MVPTASKRSVVRFRRLYKRYEKIAPAIFFALGFVFDIFTLGPIDSTRILIQHGVYLLIIFVVLGMEFRHSQGRFRPEGRFERTWEYSEALVHFLLGALLNAYLIFFFKSASLSTSYGFLILMLVLLMGNELPYFRRFGLALRSALFALCLSSYCLCLVPILLGFIGKGPFAGGLILSVTLCLVGSLWWFCGPSSWPALIRQYQVPVLLVHAIFAGLYVVHALPPVPLSINFMGIYHGVDKEGDRYRLEYTRPFWKFWERGDQTFLAREGDKLYGFASIFSPAGFEEQVKVRWLRYHEKLGWQTQDVIPFQTKGGRAQGYRGYTVKEYYSPGEWRFQVETTDGREIGRLYFEVIPDQTDGLRAVRTEFQ